MEKGNEILSEGDKNKDNNEEYKPLTEQNLLSEDDPKRIISDLTNKIFLLEKMNNELKAKNENLIKNNIKNESKLNIKQSLIGMKWSIASQMLLKKTENDSNKLAEIVKEKEDLQEINEKMLDLLTEKELENEDLMEKLKDFELKSKLEIDQNEEKIKSLEEQLKLLENSKESSSQDIDDIISEYILFQEKLKTQIKELTIKEEELLEENNLKETTIQKLSEEIHDLQINNYNLKIQSENMEKINEKEYEQKEDLITENISMKKNNEYLNEKIKLMEENIIKLNKLKEEEIDSLEKKLEEEKALSKAYKENKIKEILELKNKMNKTEQEIKYLNNKIIQDQNKYNQEKEKNYIMQTNLDKKTKEVKEISEYSKKLLTNKENIIAQYEEKISDMAKEKNELIKQNKELLEKIKTKPNEIVHTKSLEDIMNEEEQKENLDFYIKENKLLNEEINGLKEQLITKGKDLSQIKKLNEENINLKMNNEKLIGENEDIKKKLNEYQKQEEKNKLLSIKKNLSESVTKLRSINNNKEKDNYEKQIKALKKLKEEEKENYEERIKKIKKELVVMKIKSAKKQALINNANEKIKNLNIINNKEKESNQNNNYTGYIILIMALIIFFLIDKKY